MYWCGSAFRGYLNDQEGSRLPLEYGWKAIRFSWLGVTGDDLITETLKGRCGHDARGRLSHGKYVFCEVCPVTLVTITEGNGHNTEPIT